MLHKERKGKVIMRIIEHRMVSAINRRENFKLGNTEVVNCPNCQKVYLFGNLIAVLKPNSLYLTNSGCATHTTASRLRAILQNLNLSVKVRNKGEDTLFTNGKETSLNSIEIKVA